MTSYQVIFSPESQEQIANLYRYIEAAGSPQTALDYTEALVGFCEGMAVFPERGTPRDDIRPGLRTTNYRGSAIIAYVILGDVVQILGIYYGGQDYESLLLS
jgi:plasmid stabilization system protein ParE